MESCKRSEIVPELHLQEFWSTEVHDIITRGGGRTSTLYWSEISDTTERRNTLLQVKVPKSQMTHYVDILL